jgi:outer membrane protein assembly factor BamB
MNRSFIFTLLGAISILLTVSTSRSLAADWSQFLGPNRDGITKKGRIARSWPTNGPTVLWAKEVGEGFGGASIRNDEVYLLDRMNDENDILRCLNLETGEELWKVSYEAPGRVGYNGSRSTPSIGKNLIYAVSPFGNIYCVDRIARKEVWTINLIDTFGAEPPNWGFSQSPLIYKNLLIVAPMSKSAGLAGLDRATGNVVWKSEAIGGGSYVSPILRKISGVEAVLMLTKDQLTAIDPGSGKILWKYDGYFNKIPIPSITSIGDGRIFVSGGYGAGSVMIKVTAKGEHFEVSELFRMEKQGSQIQPVLLFNDYLYANFNTNENLRGDNPDGLVCLDLNGKIKWQTRSSPNFERGNLIITGGLLLILDGKIGELAMIDPNPKAYKELARTKVFDDDKGNMWGPMAFSEGKLILRSQSEMKCLDLR